MTRGRARPPRRASAWLAVTLSIATCAGWALAQGGAAAPASTAPAPASTSQAPAAPRAAAAPKAQATAPRAAEAGPAWDKLTPQQQAQLAPLRSEWPSIDAARKQKWLDVAARMPSMAADERARVQQRMTDWSRLSAAERGQARLQYQQASRVPPDSRQERWQEYQSLPTERRQELAAKAAQARPASPPAAQGSSPARPAPSSEPIVKHNLVRLPPAGQAPRAIGPTVVQARPGATTSLVTTRPSPPAHHQTGLPKIAATSDFVDPSTLLPKRGPQGAAAATPPARPAPPPVRPAPPAPAPSGSTDPATQPAAIPAAAPASGP